MNSEEECSFTLQKRKKIKRVPSKQLNFIETSPNQRYSRVHIKINISNLIIFKKD